MPKGATGGAILVATSEPQMRKTLTDFIVTEFNREVTGISETSDLLLLAIDKQVDLAVIDTNLKGLPIAKTIQIMKKCRPRVPVIVISDDYSVATGSRIMEQGVFYYMYKPIDMDSFKEIVYSALRKLARDEGQERR